MNINIRRTSKNMANVMSRYCICMLLLFLSLTSCFKSRSPEKFSSGIDFREIHHFMKVYYSVRYDAEPIIQYTWKPYYDEITIREIRKAKIRYMIGTIHSGMRHEIFIRGTANMRNALYDLKLRKHRNRKLGINLHRGFEKAALDLYKDLAPRLDMDYTVYLYGHSLGAAQAVVIGMMLDMNNYKVEKIIASGQPKVTDSEGVKKFSHLNILRIVDERDLVPFLPPNFIYRQDPYCHFGDEVVLHQGDRYSIVREREPDIKSVTAFWKNMKRRNVIYMLKEHRIKNYLQKVESRTGKSVLVPYKKNRVYGRSPN